MKIALIYGTRPEFIKMMPVIFEAKRRHHLKTTIISTGQHRELVRDFEIQFGVEPDYKLEAMNSDQTIASLSAKLFASLEGALIKERPELVLVQGDTTTALVAAQTAFYCGIAVGHIEAGLRTWDTENPFPEEANRVMVSRIAKLHFAPTPAARDNLISEGINSRNIFMTGNTIVDAIEIMTPYFKTLGLAIRQLCAASQQTILCTIHRRENFGSRLKNICDGIRLIAKDRANCQILIPLHPNPNIKEPVTNYLNDCPNICLMDPLNYPDMIHAIRKSDLIITDSGGIQEEAACFNKPLLICREKTERTEIITAGLGQLVGTDSTQIAKSASAILDSPPASPITNPFGDGTSAKQILENVSNWHNKYD